MKWAATGLCGALLLCPTMIALAAGPVVVNQLHRAFSVRELRIQRGDTVRFANIDEFLHQLYVDAKTFKFSSNEQPPGQFVEIKFPQSGTFEVRCEIHPKMLLNITVE